MEPIEVHLYGKPKMHAARGPYIAIAEQESLGIASWNEGLHFSRGPTITRYEIRRWMESVKNPDGSIDVRTFYICASDPLLDKILTHSQKNNEDLQNQLAEAHAQLAKLEGFLKTRFFTWEGGAQWQRLG